ncbi:MAG: hydroxymethylpyrimidine/phosphomethylpyrimidine kinase [Maritimibacter sp.]
MKKIMIIGGTDSSGGAGLTRDAYTARALGFEVLPIVTAVTAQTNAKLVGLHMVSPDMVAAQIKAALATDRPAAIKIGMLGSEEIAITVANALSDQSCPLVIDPVLKSSSGGQLMDGLLPRQLLSLARLITPNLPEAGALSGQPIASTDAEITTQAESILAQGAQAVLIKGGHGEGDTAADHLFDGGEPHILTSPRLHATMRGTGCTLATAIACHLADKRALPTACRLAKDFVHDRLRDAAETSRAQTPFNKTDCQRF